MSRSLIIQFFIILVALIFSIRLFSIQVINDEYKKAAQNNIIQKIIEYPYRGLIYDRDKKLLVANTPVFDLMMVPKEFNLSDSSKLMSLLGFNHAEFETKYTKARRYSRILASKFTEQIPNKEFAMLQDVLVSIDGVYVLPRTVREYPNKSLSNALGYVGEINGRQLRRDTTNYYRSGDYVGITGVEKTYEHYLRGKRGIRYKLVDVQGVVKGAFNEGNYDTVSIPGQSIQLTIDQDLQEYAEKLMEGKVGSLVAIEPSTGEILAFVSAPSYDPNLLSGRDLGANFQKMLQDSLKPIFNRPIQAMYPPGSMFKTVQSLIAMQEEVIYATEKIRCEGNLIGDHAPPGIYNVERAIQFSSNNYFYKVFKRIIQQGDNESAYLDSRIGLSTWNDYIARFGLGRRLGVDLIGEKKGHVPDIGFYDRVYGKNRWKFSNIYSLSIGQGELLVTPLQMANLGALLANKGFYYTPHIIKSIGENYDVSFEKVETGIDTSHFKSVLDGMELMVKKSAFRARIPDIDVCGKTSTVENPHGEDHSGFMAFAPRSNPKIAVAVYVENAGWGARAAASTGSLVIEKYLRGYSKRTWIENYVLKGDFTDPKPKPKPKSLVKEPVDVGINAE
ncbi:MAG: penicillin-binding protein 2 [Cyclobacteriaceae bacterium]|jgi:penicillin-binding protein 2